MSTAPGFPLSGVRFSTNRGNAYEVTRLRSWEYSVHLLLIKGGGVLRLLQPPGCLSEVCGSPIYLSTYLNLLVNTCWLAYFSKAQTVDLRGGPCLSPLSAQDQGARCLFYSGFDVHRVKACRTESTQPGGNLRHRDSLQKRGDGIYQLFRIGRAGRSMT